MYDTEHENGVLICSIHRTPISKSHGRFFCLKCQRNQDKSLGAEMADAFDKIIEPKPKCRICGDSGVYDYTIVTGEKIVVRCFHNNIKY